MPRIATRRVRLDSRRAIAVAACVVLAARQLLVWHWVQRRVLPEYHVLACLSSIPKSLFWAVTLASPIALLAKGLVAVLVRPLIERWHAPETNSSMLAFHLGPGERLVAEMGARRAAVTAAGRKTWRAGTLVRTTHRLAFFPEAWDEEPWTLPWAEAVAPRLEPTLPFGLRLMRGWPDRLAVGDGDATEVFVVADPPAALAWFDPLKPPKNAPASAPARLEFW